MANRTNETNAIPSHSTTWHRMNLSQLVELIASRTGLEPKRIRLVLQELGDTLIYVRTPESVSETGRSGEQHPEDKAEEHRSTEQPEGSIE